ncbi:hypothetical protein DERP_010789 [Dermatophagoides pteronyssinus]|uniref:Transmembrane protein n=1 Tax=Dermatophagoides pteronyssinus TaxID=6956 RepID=A0ABQ8J6N2_DERPT|nr:hypothetical protein DERP_010789 [Dermatophagoides pteronyssinus]
MFRSTNFQQQRKFPNQSNFLKINIKQIENYFQQIYLINVGKNKQTIRKIYWKMSILIIWSIRFLYMYLNNDNHSFEWHLIHFNPVKMANIDNKLNLFNASFGCLFVYFIYILYFCNNTRATQLIYRVLIDGDQRFFIREKSLSTLNGQNIVDDDDYQRQKIVRRIRLWLTIYHQAFHFLYYASCKFILNCFF